VILISWLNTRRSVLFSLIWLEVLSTQASESEWVEASEDDEEDEDGDEDESDGESSTDEDDDEEEEEEEVHILTF